MYNFGVHTIKNFDHTAEWEPSYRMVGAGNNVFVLSGGKWVKMKTVIDRQKDAIESATLETTRLFVHTQKIKNRKIRKDDADGAYLQAPSDESKRPKGLFAVLPECMWPANSEALNMRRPVWRCKVSQYGVDDAGFSWDRYSRAKLVENNFHPYYDLSQSLYDVYAKDADVSILKKEGEIDPSEYPKDIGSVSQYVDDFLSAEDEGAGVYELMTSALRFKPSGEETETGDLGRYVGSEWEGVNDPPDADGVYRYSAQQMKYVETFVKQSEESFARLGQKPIREVDTPALANDSKKSKELDETPGVFQDISASIVCALLYVARSTRLDILYAVCRLTRYISPGRWMVRQDQWLYRVLGYLKKTTHLKLNFKICPADFEEGGDGQFENWSDSDLGGDEQTKRSTSGGCGLLVGSNSLALVEAHCKRQGQAGISTPEAETVAMVVQGKKSIPLHMMGQRLLKRDIKLIYKGDNAACERVIGTGISQALAYMKRTCQLSLTWAHENMARYITRTPTQDNISDLWTKPLEQAKFEKFRRAIGIF